MGTRTLFVLLLLGCSAAAQGGEHPVPLSADFDPAKCVECHRDHTEGKYIHTAITIGCNACHEVKIEGTVTSVTTIAKGRALCVSCHTDKDKAEAKGNLHPPVAQDCTKCHSPHSSPYKFQLLKERTGGPAENLCLGCHDKGVNVPDKGSRHIALDMGCDTCHVTHKTGEPGKKEFDYHLTKSPPALCLDCHDASDKSLKETHHNQPFDKAVCTDCHDPHQSASPKLLQKTVHFPFAEKMCEVCHQPAKDGKVVLNEDGKFELCYTCHDEIKKLVETSKNQHLAFSVTDRCTTCHSPHASRYPRLLKQPVGVCVQCHEERADEQKTKKFLHPPVFRDGCYICHQPHGSENPTLLRTAQVNDICLTCHSITPHVETKPDSKTMTLFSSVVLPADYLDSVKRIDVSSNGRGHPIGNHPVAGMPDPSKPGSTINCISCHDPHASDFTRRRFRMKQGQTVICLKCHGKQ